MFYAGDFEYFFQRFGPRRFDQFWESNVRIVLVVFMIAISGCGPGDQKDSDDSPTGTISGDTLAIGSEQLGSEDAAPLADSLAALAARVDSIAGTASELTPESVDRLADAINHLGLAIANYTHELTRSSGTVSEAVQPAGRRARGYGFRIFLALFVLTITYFMVRGTSFILELISERNAEHRLLVKRLVPIVRVVFWSTAIYFIMRGIFDVNSQNIFAAAAAVGVAVGFAAQGIIKNIFGGFVIISDRPFQVGDKISVGGTYGEVTSIGLRSTRIVTADDNTVTVPNAQVIDSQIANANSGELTCQVVTDLYLPGHVDEAKAKKIAYEAATSSSYVFLGKPVVVLVLDEFRETFITHLQVKAYVFDTRFEFLLQSEITERARKGFREAGMVQTLHGARAYVDLTSIGRADDRLETKDGSGIDGGDND